MFSTYKDDYVEGLEQQLAKANERIEEVEDENLTLLNTMAQYPDFFTEKDRQALNKFAIEQKVEAFENAQIPRHAKAGCIGEFNFTIEDANCCPQCWYRKSDDCDMCNGKTDDNGLSDLTATVPWVLCKEIWLRMNKIYAEQLNKEQEK